MTPLTDYERHLLSPEGQALRQQLRQDFGALEASLRARIRAMEFNRQDYARADACAQALAQARQFLADPVEVLAQASHPASGR